MFLTLLRRAGPLVGSALVVFSFSVLLLVGLGPHTGRYRTLTVLSGSMGSTAPAGSLAVVAPVALTDVEVGDVITYQIPVEDHRVVTHRVVEVVEAGEHPEIRTKGDANAAADPWVARLEGTTAWETRMVVPGLGRAIQALRQPWLRALLVRLVPALFALVWLIEIWRPGAGRRRRASLQGLPS
jgi:signal peptidase I